MAVVLPQIFQVASRIAQPLKKPRLLFGAENGLSRAFFAEVFDFDAPELDGVRRLAAIVGASRIKDFDGLFGNELGKGVTGKRLGFGAICGLFGTITALVGDDEFDVAAPAQSSIALQAVDGGKIVRFLAETVLVEVGDRRVSNLRAIETLQGRTTRLRHACRLVFKKRLIGGNFACLRGPRLPFEFLQGLPAEPAEFVIVPHIDERPTRACVLEIRVAEISAINGAIVLESRRNVKVADFLAVRVAHDIA